MDANKPFDIHHNPYPEGRLPPPWYRPPPGVDKGPRRTRASIIGGLLIDNDEGRRWFKDSYGFELAADHLQDITITIRLSDLIIKKDINAFDCCTAPRRLDTLVSDFLIITHIQQGPFVHSGPETYEEVLEEDRKPVPGVREKEVEEQLMKELGIKTCSYKSYYSNAY